MKARSLLVSFLFLSFTSCSSDEETVAPPPPPPVDGIPGFPSEPPRSEIKGSPEPEKTAEKLKKKIWVLPFKEHSNPPEGLQGVMLGEPVRRSLIKAFAENSKSNFLTDGSEDNIAVELPPVDAEPKEIAKLARQAGISGFLRGEVSDLKTIYGVPSAGFFKTQRVDLTMTVNYELFDSGSGRRVAQGYETQNYGETRSDIVGKTARIPDIDKKAADLGDKMSARMVVKLAPFSERLGWTGRVLRADATRIFVNAGRKSGVQIGEVLKVVENPTDILDPISGNFVGQAPGRMKGTVKLIQYFGQDGSIAILQSGGGILTGDRVELF